MAALANIYSRMMDRRTPEAGGPRTPVAAGFAPLRTFANEDVYFYIKRIDNTGVVRQSDPRARGSAWKLIGAVGAVSVLAIGVLLPGAYDLMAGYEIQKLKQEATDLKAEQASLDIAEARLLTPQRIEALAHEQQFTDPAQQNLVFLNSQDQSAVAVNRPAAEPQLETSARNAKR